MPKTKINLGTLKVFHAMRLDLAYANGLMKNPCLEATSKVEGPRLGFLNSPSGSVDVEIHNFYVIKILFAFLYQALQNYLKLVKVDPRLRDEDLESLLNQHGHREEFIECLRISRHDVFHIRGEGSIERSIKNESRLISIVEQRGGARKALENLLDALYGFTWKVFGGNLHIFPEWIHEIPQSERRKMVKEIFERIDRNADTTIGHDEVD